MDQVKLLGIPLDANSSFLRGPAKAPAAIRHALASDSGNDVTEHGVAARTMIADLGDVAVANETGSVSDADLITHTVEAAIADGTPLMCLGGDHSVTYPILRAFSLHHRSLTVVHIDAHPDLYDDLDGNPLSHASPFARALEDRCMSRLIQLGIRTATAHQHEQAARWQVQSIPARRIADFDPADIEAPVYLTVDLDGLDPSVAPGVSHHEPGGLTMREVLDIIDALPRPIVGADVVEFNPDRDLVNMTAAVAAKLTKEIVGAMVTRNG